MNEAKAQATKMLPMADAAELRDRSAMRAAQAADHFLAKSKEFKCVVELVCARREK